mmetsp:Transcript_6876/g.19127  ORF Transcript_6876/g.19127 Transcript_6876/m.19127 type:complete len:270 (+) Transcript_6876:441-1250(+)
MRSSTTFASWITRSPRCSTARTNTAFLLVPLSVKLHCTCNRETRELIGHSKEPRNLEPVLASSSAWTCFRRSTNSASGTCCLILDSSSFTILFTATTSPVARLEARCTVANVPSPSCSPNWKKASMRRDSSCGPRTCTPFPFASLPSASGSSWSSLALPVFLLRLAPISSGVSPSVEKAQLRNSSNWMRPSSLRSISTRSSFTRSSVHVSGSMFFNTSESSHSSTVPLLSRSNFLNCFNTSLKSLSPGSVPSSCAQTIWANAKCSNLRV